MPAFAVGSSCGLRSTERELRRPLDRGREVGERLVHRREPSGSFAASNSASA